MKKLLFSVLMVFVLLVGCNTNGETAEDEIEVTMIISVDHDEERLVDETLTVSEGATVLAVLEDHYEVTATSDGFIEAIEGHEQSGDTYWFYEVNDEEAYVGAGDYTLSDNDVVHFDLHAWEG